MTATPKNTPPMTMKAKKLRLQMIGATFDYHKALTGYALYKTNDKDLSDDLVQKTFLKALLYLQKGGEIDTMRIFLNHILRGLIIDEYRRHKTTSLDFLLEKGFDPSFDDREKTINIYDGKRIIVLIDALPIKYQIVMRMKFLQDLSIAEIALLTGQVKNTVAVQLCRGLQKLKILVQEDEKKFKGLL